jgi:hypothetical protein
MTQSGGWVKGGGAAERDGFWWRDERFWLVAMNLISHAFYHF